MIKITELAIHINGKQTAFKFDRDVEGGVVILEIRCPDAGRTVYVNMSEAQYEALGAAHFDVAGEEHVTGSWFGGK